jgi:hypothetical protein
VTLFGALISVSALIVVILKSGEGKASMLCTILVYVGYWPMLAMGWSLQNLFASLWILPANLIGWGVVGFVFGVLMPIRTTGP